mmetsp:Transcript_7050/g.12617  ORF Transcript_7050/g.12617 Transcript_7050/m.12617 type:complete len:511 (+) Transcript_7050:79-1611(+)
MMSSCSMTSLALLVLLSGSSVDAFAPPQSSSLVAHQLHQRTHLVSLLSRDQDDDDSENAPAEQQPSSLPTRRDALRQSAAAIAAGLLVPSSAWALPPIASFSNPFAPQASQSNGGYYIPAKRCTAYQVDATIPPSLIPYRAGREAAILKNLGMGLGTAKKPIVEDEVNLNNMMNKAVFGTIDTVKKVVVGDSSGELKSGVNHQSFVFLGANFDDTYTASVEKMAGETNADASLAVGLLTDICKPKERNGNTAVGLAFAPQSSQSALNDYLSSNGSEDEVERTLVEGLTAAGANEELAKRHLPILRFAKKKRCALLALAPELSDLETLQKGGLQSLDSERRDAYVADAQGFIAWTQEPKSKLYTDKSLMKDLVPTSTDEAALKVESGNFFAERILVHEACATAISKWATSRADSMVITIASIPDVRFLGGINGRVPRVCQHLNPASLVDNDAVTTILLNPNARETLSESKFLRLEIGTAPNNWTYQTKVADYLWFSSMPKVNMIPRMMNEQ